MRILHFFITLVYCTSVLQNIRQQGQQVYGSLAHHANSIRDLSLKKLKDSANILKGTVEKVKEKINGKKEIKNEIPDDFELDSTMLKEFLEQLSKQFEGFKKAQDEKNEKDDHDHKHDSTSEDEKSRKEAL